ncbi:sigma-54 interaction domain-containing protein [Thermosediminibacter litoriperuensis]|uniref:Arginine utilization regulatory protein n=1 Tax=Thermosediminibacter litoriperuensis TaxID=291989 RepID=A0A5S5AUZ1_9FIRM|nr:sigma 54-interacting transcriptional regulator [Thermosediminibacter litoriperuensis]TYP55433.1 arginine utilization regulatory protein [Thermosediminibacter litoriperuensis]
MVRVDYKFLFESMLAHLKQGILVVDTKANVIFYNEPVTQIAGINPQEAIGKNILEIFPDLTPETSTFYYVLRTGKPLVDYIQTYINFKGEKVTTLTSTMPLIKCGKIVGAFELYRELSTVRELSEKIVSLQRELYKKASCEKNHIDCRAVYTFDDIIGKSPAIRELIERAKKVADSPSPILVYGETGTGKELLVQAIHNASLLRRDKPFIAQNCAALPKTLLEGILFGTTAGSFTGARDRPGLFELANGGTLFLDEINSMDIELQAKLLRVLQDGVIRRVGGVRTTVVDVRVIASTNEPPRKAIERKLLREDLYYRLNVISLKIPPLRERKEDIPLLVEHFIKLYNKQLGKNVKGVSPGVMELFMNYRWPGNVRELKSIIENAMNFIEGEIIEVKNLSQNYDYFLNQEEIRPMRYNSNSDLPSLNEAVGNFEKNLILKAICAANGNYAKAARLLKVPRQTLHNKVKKYGLMKKNIIK